MKKLWCFLGMCMSVGIPCLAESFSAQNADDVSLTYEIASDSTVSIVSGESLYAGNIVIPDSVLNGEIWYDVKAIGRSAFQNCTNLTSVTIPNSVTTIGEDAFRSCVSLTAVAIPDGVNSFARNVFYGCTNLSSVTLGDSLRLIGGGSFYECTSLESMVIPNSVVTIEDRVFEGCSKLSSITLGDSVKYIGEYNFYRCNNLQTVNVNSLETVFNITYNGSYSNPFSETHKLYLNGEEVTELVIPEGVMAIPGGILANVTGITSVTIPGTVTSIGDNAFHGCTNLATVTLPDSSVDIAMGKDVFAGTAWLNNMAGEVIYVGSTLYKYQGTMPENTTIEVKEGTTAIAEGAFYNCTNLTAIEFPASVTSIGKNAFAGTTWYDTLDDGPVYINNILYKYKGEMPANTSVEVAEGTVCIAEGAFENYTQLTKVILPASVTTIEKQAFTGCTSLVNLTLGDGLTTIGDNAFQNCSNLSNVYATSVEQLFAISYGTEQSNLLSLVKHLYINDEEVTALTVPEGITEINDGFLDKLSSNITSLILPNSVKTIGDKAFNGWSNLTSITLGESVESIGSNAFQSCAKLDSVVIPNSVVSIGSWAFSDCSNLSYFTLGNSVQTIGYAAFNNCPKLQTVNVNDLAVMFNVVCGSNSGNPFQIATTLHLNGEEITELEIPEGVTEIKQGFFYNFWNIVTSVIIPNSVKSINGGAFQNWSELESISLGDSIKTVGLGAFDGCNKLAKVNVPNISTLCDIEFARRNSGGGNSNPLSIAKHLYLNGEEVTELIIPDDVTHISNYAFSGAASITSVSIPISVKSLGEYVFHNCDALSYVTLGDSVKTIGDCAFRFCDSLKTVNIHSLETMFNLTCNGSSSNPFSIASKLHLNGEEFTNLVIPEYLTEINKGFFYNFGNNITSLTIPNSVTKVGDYTFQNWPKLASVSLERTGKYAFEGCSALTSITLESSVDTIAVGAFRYCKGLESVVIPNTVVAIEKAAFEGCTNLSSVTFGDSIASVGGYAFNGCDSLKRVDVTNLDTWYAINFENQSANPLTIAQHLYYNGEEVTGLTIPEGITEINEGFFKGYENITSIVLPNSVVTIGDRAFRNLTNLQSVTLSNALKHIGSQAFSGCTSLSSIAFPDSLEFIGYHAFDGCINLESVSLGSHIKTIEQNVFQGCDSLKRVDVTDAAAYFAINFGSDSSNPAKIAKGLYCDGELVTEYVQPYGATIVNQNLLSGYDFITSLVFANSVQEISGGWNMFASSKSLTKVVLPNSLKKISGHRIFAECQNLRSITFGDSLMTVDAHAFYKCDSLEEVHISNLESWFNIDFYDGLSNPLSKAQHFYVNGEEITELVVPNTVKEIKSLLFAGSKITSLKTGDSVEKIGNSAFANCTALTSVTFGESIDSVATNAFVGCDSLKRVNVSNLDTWYAIYFENESANPLTIAKHLYYNGEEVTGFVIPEGITEINEGFFKGYENITSVVLPKSVKKIGYRAFYNLANLQSVTLNDSLQSIGESAFMNCTALTTVVIPNSVKTFARNVFYGCSNLSSVTLGDSLQTIGGGSFHDCTSLKSIVIPNSVVTIEDRVFEFCSNLSYISLGDSLKTIGDYAFNGCDSLQTANVSDLAAVFAIAGASNLFSRVSKLYVNGEEVTELIIPEGITEIHNGFFYNCVKNVTSVIISNSVTRIGGSTFQGWSNLESVVIGNSVKEIDSYAFYGCSELSDITLGDSIKRIGLRVFDGCDKLAKVNVTNIKTYCNIEFMAYNSSGGNSNPLSYANHLYLNGEEVTELIIPEGTSQISNYAFYGASSITSVTIPKSVKRIGDYSFTNCRSLSHIELGDSVLSFGRNAFNDCDSLTINVVNLEALFNDFKFNGYRANPFEIAKELYVNNEPIIDLVVPNTVKRIPGNVFNGRKIESLTIPNSVEYIGDNAFKDCAVLESVTLGNSVDTIGSYAFHNCKALTSVEIPNSTTAILENAFSACSKLESVTFGDKLETIGEWAFSECKALTSIEIPNSVINLLKGAFNECHSLSSITLGNSIQTIGEQAFAYCKALTSIVIPNTVTDIAQRAFYDCYGLQSVTLGNSIETIGNSAFGYIGHGLSDGQQTKTYLPNIDLLFKVQVEGNNEYLLRNLYVGNQPLTALEVPDNVVDAPILSQLYNTSITSLNTGNGLKTLPKGDSYKITQLTLGSNVKKVEGNFPNALIVISNASEAPSITESTFPKCMFDNGADGVVVLPTLEDQSSYSGAEVWEGMQLTNQSNKVDVMVSTPGELSFEIIDKHSLAPAKVVGLTIRGEINDDDFMQMNKNMKALLYLDLTNAKVEKVPDNAFEGKQQLLSLKLANTTKVIGNSAFKGCNGIKELVMPTDVKEIGDEAFAGTNMTTLDFNYALQKIGNRAFANTPLEEISFQYKLESIGREAFQGCNLEQVLEFPETLTSIGERAFDGQRGITGHLTIPEAVTSVGQAAFRGTNISTVFISGKMTTLESYVFENCPLLDVVYIPDNITRINESAFRGCSSLVNLRLSQNVEEIGREAFRSLPIKSVSVPENMVTLRGYTFADCANLRYASLPSTITSLEEGVFYNCRQLMNLTVKALTPPTVQANTFRGVNTDRCIVSIPTESYKSYVLAEYWGRFIQMRNDIAVQTKGNGTISFASGETEGEEYNPTPVTRSARAVTNAETEANSPVTTVEDGSSLYVPKNGTVRFYITPAEGEEIVSATFDGEDITSQIVNGVFETTADKKSADLVVNFSELTKTAQVITWNQEFEQPVMVGDKITLNAAASSGLSVNFAFGNDESGEFAQISDSTLAIVKSGTIAVIAQQQGNDQYAFIATDAKYIQAYEYGDANGNREINSADLATTIDYAIGNEPEEFLFRAADVNKDQRVNVADVSGVVDIVLTAPAADANVMTRTWDLTTSGVLCAEMSTQSLDLKLADKMDEYLTFQCDVRLSDGCTPKLDEAGNPIVTIQSTEGIGTQVAVARLLEDGSIRMLIYSTDNTPMTHVESLKLQLERVSQHGDIAIEHAGYSCREYGDIVYRTFEYAYVDGMESMEDVIAHMKIKTDGEEISIYSPVDYQLPVTSVDGIVHMLDVKAGHNKFTMKQGVYIIGNNKIIVK